MKTITLKTGENVLVDDDFVLEEGFSLSVLVQKKKHFITKYIVAQRCRNGKKEFAYLHRLVMNAKKGQIVDHIDGDSFDNRKSQLRFCTHSENIANQRRHKKQFINAPFKGVYKYKNKYKAQINYKGKTYYLGFYEIAKEAARRYDQEALKLFGEFATLNFSQ